MKMHAHIVDTGILFAGASGQAFAMRSLRCGDAPAVGSRRACLGPAYWGEERVLHRFGR